MSAGSRMPITPVSGVRNSCEVLAKNWSLSLSRRCSSSFFLVQLVVFALDFQFLRFGFMHQALGFLVGSVVTEGDEDELAQGFKCKYIRT